MTSPNILHMFSATKHVSPFDVNMAADAGFDVIVPYGNVMQREMTALTQDAMFSRSPEDCKRTGGFIGGKNAILSLEMMDDAKAAMFPPFQFSLFADPAGSFTTAGAMVACVRRALRKQMIDGLKGLKVVVYGATGVVGFASGVIAGLEGAGEVVLVGYDGTERVQKAAEDARARFGCQLGFADGSTDEKNGALAEDADVIFSAGPAGRQILSKEHLRRTRRLKVAADVNAVSPAGIEGVGVNDDGVPLAETNGVGIGALAIGDIKYKAQSGLFKRMIEEDGPMFLDFLDAYELAKQLAG